MRVRRGTLYLALVVVAGMATATWWTVTEEVAPDANEPDAYDLFLMVFTAGAVVAAAVVCVCVEVVYRLIRWSRMRRQSDSD
jgi:hypothetical protein